MIRYLSIAFALYLAPVAVAGDFKGADTAVCIKRTSTDGKFSGGSGNCVGYDAFSNTSTILTAAHVVPDAGKKLIVVHKGKEYAGTYVYGSKVTEVQNPDGSKSLSIEGPDLCLISVNAKLPVARLSDKPAKVGDRIWTYGFPGNRTANGPYAKTGEVTDLNIWTTADARPGDSGTALFNEAGEIVGVVHARSVDADEPAGLALPLETVKDFLKDALKAKVQPKVAPAPKVLPAPPVRPHCTPHR